MLFFEFFPAALMLICVPIPVWLYMMNRQARRMSDSQVRVETLPVWRNLQQQQASKEKRPW
jgi:hypothetical protein